MGSRQVYCMISRYSKQLLKPMECYFSVQLMTRAQRTHAFV